ncbi:MAG: hypothetical protein ABSE49_25115 [Polyangiaceae bacterium]
MSGLCDWISQWTICGPEGLLALPAFAAARFGGAAFLAAAF